MISFLPILILILMQGATPQGAALGLGVGILPNNRVHAAGYGPESWEVLREITAQHTPKQVTAQTTFQEVQRVVPAGRTQAPTLESSDCERPRDGPISF